MFSERRTWTGESTSTTVEVAFTDTSVDFREGAHADRSRLEGDLSRLEAEIGVPVARMHQVHGSTVADVVDASQVPRADAVVTDVPGLALMSRTADCVPVLLAAPSEGLVAAVHAGRVGVALGVVPQAVEHLRQRGASGLRAWVGPRVCGRCYEVPAEMRAAVAEVVPATAAQTSWGTPALDLGAGVRAQLDAAGVEHEDVAGRLATLVWVRP